MYSIEQEYSLCDVITSAQVIATAKLRLGIDSTEFDLWMEIELENTLKNFGSLGTVTKVIKPVTFEDCKVKLPRGIRRFIGVRNDFCLDGVTTVDEDTDQPTPLYLFTRGFLLSYNNCGDFYRYFDLRDGYIYIRDSSLDGVSISLCYEGFATNDNNEMLIFDIYESCLAWKLAELFLLTEPDFYGPGKEYIASQNATRFQKKFKAEKDKIRADEQRTAWKNDAVKMAVIQDRVHISDYRLYWTY